MATNPASAPAEHLKTGLAALNAVKTAARAEADRLAAERAAPVTPPAEGGQPPAKGA